MRVGGDLLEKMALAGPARSQLHRVVVVLDEGDHAQQHHIPGAWCKRLGLQADTAQQERLPLLEAEGRAPAGHGVQGIAFGELDLAQRLDAEGPAVLLLGDARVVVQVQFGIEAAGQHPLVGVDQGIVDADLLQPQAWQFRHEAIVLRVQLGGHQVDQLDPALLLGARLEQFLLTGAHRAAGELALHDLQTLLNLRLIGAGAVAPEQELAHIGRHRILALEPAHQVLADEEAVEGLGGKFVECVELHGSIPPKGAGPSRPGLGGGTPPSTPITKGSLATT